MTTETTSLATATVSATGAIGTAVNDPIASLAPQDAAVAESSAVTAVPSMPVALTPGNQPNQEGQQRRGIEITQESGVDDSGRSDGGAIGRRVPKHTVGPDYGASPHSAIESVSIVSQEYTGTAAGEAARADASLPSDKVPIDATVAGLTEAFSHADMLGRNQYVDQGTSSIGVKPSELPPTDPLEKDTIRKLQARVTDLENLLATERVRANQLNDKVVELSDFLQRAEVEKQRAEVEKRTLLGNYNSLSQNASELFASRQQKENQLNILLNDFELLAEKWSRIVAALYIRKIDEDLINEHMKVHFTSYMPLNILRPSGASAGGAGRRVIDVLQQLDMCHVCNVVRKSFCNQQLSGPILSSNFVYNRLVNQQHAVLSVGSGDGSFENALRKMRGDDAEDNVIASTFSSDLAPGLVLIKSTINSDLDPGLNKLGWNIDATNINSCWERKPGDIMFNMPWPMGDNASTPRDYFNYYDLTRIFRDLANKNHYDLDVIDIGIHDSAWNNGYQHHSDINDGIGQYLPGTCVMLCFKRK
ncbi:hypothetical protein HK405_003789 [Cladochytrium tenue]|nr:hypothetical protein HK405_003789 [Cladochytrium tenue]